MEASLDDTHRQGILLFLQGKLDEAEKLCHQLLEKSSTHADTFNLLGLIAFRQGRLDEAFERIGAAIGHRPEKELIYNCNKAYILGETGQVDQSVSLYLQTADKFLQRQESKEAFSCFEKAGILLSKNKRLEEAIDCFKKALLIDMRSSALWNQVGLNYQAMGRLEEAASAFQNLLSFDPNNLSGRTHLGIALNGLGRTDEALECFLQVCSVDPTFLPARNGLGIVYYAQGEVEKALEQFRFVVEKAPQCPEGHNNLGIILRERLQLEEALLCFAKAIELSPTYADAYNNKGNALRDLMRLVEAMQSYQTSLELRPDAVDTIFNIALLYQDLRQYEKSEEYYKKALELNPKRIDTLSSLGSLYMQLLDTTKAFAAYDQIIKIDAQNTKALAYLHFELMHLCKWDEAFKLLPDLDRNVREALRVGLDVDEPAFMNFMRCMDPAHNLLVSKSCSEQVSRRRRAAYSTFNHEGRFVAKEKLRIGYISNDLYNHATMHLMRSLFKLHNQERFEIYTYSYSKKDDSHYRSEVERASTCFIDISQMGDYEASKKIYDDKIDILIDLKGHTSGTRLGILAFRPAPIQIAYLGYPGTSGADFIDYIIGDRIVTPLNEQHTFSEKIIQLPNTYQVTDWSQEIAPMEFTRASHSLPEDAFVFASFNNFVKLDPILFACWMRILKAIPKGVLWLLLDQAAGADNLRKEAEKAGIEQSRLIFGLPLRKDVHLGRLRFADLALDTIRCNGHTTTSDALWAGVPVVTLKGGHFASRVSSSLLSAIGLSELITHTLKDYERLIIRLAKNPTTLKSIRSKLEANRTTYPLFDTPQFTHHLEAAYQMVWDRAVSGLSPGHIEIPQN